MSSRAPMLSPISLDGSDWSSLRHQNATSTDQPYSPTLVFNAGPSVTPPASSHTSSATDMGVSLSGGGPRPGSRGNPSPPASIARSSDGSALQTRVVSSGRKQQVMEEALAEHHSTLRRFLAPTLNAEKANPKPNKARDKLFRLSAVQFQELSTDVYDELLRREDQRLKMERGVKSNDIAQFLLPKENYHPKRNQARQKLSTLATERFQQLVMDVFYELERRFPRFCGVEADRAASLTTSIASTAVDVTFRKLSTPSPWPPPSYAVPQPRGSTAAYGTYPVDIQEPQASKNYGRPLPKTFNSNTITPNKGTMVEDDDQSGYEDDNNPGANGVELEGATRLSKRKTDRSLRSDDRERELQTQIEQLRKTAEELDAQLRGKNEEAVKLKMLDDDRKVFADAERGEWSKLRLDLERRLGNAQSLNDSMREELERLQTHNAQLERDMEAQFNAAKELNDDGDWRRRYEGMEKELREQQHVTDEVRRNAADYLTEMRSLMESSGHTSGNEERLLQQVSRLDEEVKQWKSRYTRTKAQLRSLRAMSMGLSMQPVDADTFVRDGGFADPDGLIKDVNVTKFQIAIDELLYSARNAEPDTLLQQMKSVVVCVRNITTDLDGTGASNEDVSKQRIRLKAKVSATANNLTTVCKIHSTSKGLSPLSLLDAAACHLTTAVVELIRTVKIRITAAGDLEDDDDGNLPPEAAGYASLTSGYSPHSRNTSFGSSLTSSTFTSPQRAGHGGSRKSSSASRQSSARSLSGYGRFRRTSVEPRLQEEQFEKLSSYLEEQTQTLVSSIQPLVDRIRRDDDICAVKDNIRDIAAVLGDVVTTVDQATHESDSASFRKHVPPVTEKLDEYKSALLAISTEAEAIDDPLAQKNYTKSKLPPLAFKIVRRTKELRLKVDHIDNGELRESEEVRLDDD